MANKDILFLLSHQPNPRFIKQINFLSQNHRVSVIYFYRRYMHDLQEEYAAHTVMNKALDSIPNGNYLKRIYAYMLSYRTLRAILKRHRFDTVVVNNIDTLALFKLASPFRKKPAKIAMEISDLREHTYSTSFKAKLIRYVEAFLFKYVDKLIVTSPKFYELYYSKLFKGSPFVLENKPLSYMMPRRLTPPKRTKTVIGIVGLLLQGKPYQTLFEALKDSKDTEVHIYGKGTYERMVQEYADRYDNITYFGPYNFFKDSARIYASIDILYMPYDTTNGSLNNKVALPNKLYEAIYYRVPIITSKGTYLGERVEAYQIGVGVECCDTNALLDALASFDTNKAKAAFARLDANLYMADNDYKKLETYVTKDDR